ncbi:MAG: M56 family metallopeptidase [Phycisphaerales bacterium]|nr:M56 family metallopeptidase [Phycisphaerales bacterium]
MSEYLTSTWADLAWRGLLQGSLAFVVLYALWWPWRRRASAQLACVLFSLALLKVALPVELPAPGWLAPLAMDGWLPAAATPSPLLLPDDAWVAPGAASSGEDSASVLHVAAAPVAVPLAGVSGFDLRALLFWGWVVGASLLGVRFLRNELRTLRAVRRARPVGDGEIGLELDALRVRAGVRRRVRWLSSPSVATPAAGGLLRPYVLLPVGFAEHLPPRQLTFVLLHELAHIRRGDLAVAAAQRLVQILWFFHPAVWLASRLVEQHRELACDQDALARSGASRRECGEAFLSVVAWVHGREVEPTATLAMFDPTRVLKRRLMQILTDSRPGHASRWLGAAYLAFAAAVTLPSAKATAAPTADLPTLVVQDPGQSEQLAQLQQALAELRKQQAELARQLKALHAAKAQRPERAAKDEGDDDDAADAARARRLPLSVLRRARDTKPEAAEGQTKKSATRAFTFDGENVFEVDGNVFEMDGKAFTFEGGKEHSVDASKAGEWFTTKGSQPGWKVWRSGEGDDAGKTFHVQGGDGVWVFRTDGEEGGKVLWTGPDGEWQKRVLPKGALRFAPGVKVERGPDGEVFRLEVRSEDIDDDASVDTKKERSKKTRTLETIVEKPTVWRAVREVEGQPLKLRKVEGRPIEVLDVEGQPIEVLEVQTVGGKRKIVV